MIMTIITTTATFCSSKHGQSQTHRSRVVTRTPNPPPSSAKNHHYYDYQLSFLSIWKLFTDVYWWSSIAKETFGFLSLFEQLWLEVILSSNCITIYDVDQYSTFDVYLMQYAVGVCTICKYSILSEQWVEVQSTAQNIVKEPPARPR